jgi:hypothetical protein
MITTIFAVALALMLAVAPNAQAECAWVLSPRMRTPLGCSRWIWRIWLSSGERSEQDSTRITKA